jgi:glutamate racemase
MKPGALQGASRVDQAGSVRVGVFDSGIGGLTVLRAIRAEIPGLDLVYLADTVHIPYGTRPAPEVRGFSEGITRFLLARGARAIVVACNTASGVALGHLRQTFAGVPFVGMEPAVKPAALESRSRVVGVLATPTTFQTEAFSSLVERFASGVTVLRQVCPGLVQRIEAGNLETPETEAALRAWVEPLLGRGADTLVLGCTHYPFVRPTLERICGPGVRVIDPAPAVARQLGRVLERAGLVVSADRPGRVSCFTSGSVEALGKVLARLGEEAVEVRGVVWEGERLREAP